MYVQGACFHRVPGKEYRRTILDRLRYERERDRETCLLATQRVGLQTRDRWLYAK